jgi:hypothetical protein
LASLDYEYLREVKNRIISHFKALSLKENQKRIKEAIKIAKRYNTVKEFMTHDNSIYRFVEANKINEAKVHFKRLERCSFGEYFCHKIFKGLLGKKFIKTKTVLGGLELDGYNAELKLAFEYNGAQHYKMTKQFHPTPEDFTNQLKRDALKRQRCKTKGIRLITVPYLIKIDELQPFIEAALEKLNIPFLDKRIKLKTHPGSMHILYNHHTLPKIAAKYKTRNNFREGNKSAYNAAQKLKIIDAICSHMLSKEEAAKASGLRNQKWTEAKLRAMCKKMKIKSELAKKSRSAYNAAFRMGMLNELFP